MAQESRTKNEEPSVPIRDGIISILESIQADHGYLPEAELKKVAEETRRSLVDIYGVATFYKSFSLKPRGKHLICVCLGTACHVRGGPNIQKEFETQLGICAGETTKNNKFTLETVACLGACALGPIVISDGHYFSKVVTPNVKQILKKTDEGLDRFEIKTDERIFPLELSCARCNHSLMDPENMIDEYPSIKLTLSFERMHGWLRLSSLYGSFNIESEYEIPPGVVCNFFCPHCHAEMRGGSPCPDCSSITVPMIVRGGGMIQICSRRGCKWHMLDLTGINY